MIFCKREKKKKKKTNTHFDFQKSASFHTQIDTSRITYQNIKKYLLKERMTISSNEIENIRKEGNIMREENTEQ